MFLDIEAHYMTFLSIHLDIDPTRIRRNAIKVANEALIKSYHQDFLRAFFFVSRLRCFGRPNINGRTYFCSKFDFFIHHRNNIPENPTIRCLTTYTIII